MFPAIGAASRDHKLGTSDLVWANSVTPAQVMRARTLAILTQVMILFSLTTGFLFVMQSAMGLEVDSALQLHLYLFLAAILLLIMGFMNADVEFVRYLSILYYFDAVGLVYGQVELGVSLLRVGIFTAVSALIYLVGLQRYIRTNLS